MIIHRKTIKLLFRNHFNFKLVFYAYKYGKFRFNHMVYNQYLNKVRFLFKQVVELCIIFTCHEIHEIGIHSISAHFRPPMALMDHFSVENIIIHSTYLSKNNLKQITTKAAGMGYHRSVNFATFSSRMPLAPWGLPILKYNFENSKNAFFISTINS